MSDDPRPLQRARDFADRARHAPASIAELVAAHTEVRAALARLEQLAEAGRLDTRGGVTAVGAELNGLRDRLQALAEDLAAVDGTVAAHAAALRRTLAAPARAAAAAELRTELGPSPDLRPGLSVFTLCWNHGPLLERSVRSGLAALDLLASADQGELLILDDASSDSTAEVAAALAAEDPRVRVVRAGVNLGLAHARSTLLHTATTAHAFQLDADNEAVPDGVVDLYRSALATGAVSTYGTVAQVDADGVAKGVISNEVPTPAEFRSNYIDTCAVTDVAALRRLGGWATDPLLEHVDDWATVHLLAREGLLLAFVPVLVAAYHDLPTGFHHTVADPRVGHDRIARVIDPTGLRRGDGAMEGVAAVAHHPDAGVLWATPAAVALDPTLTPPAAAAPMVHEPERRVLLVAPGGVDNLGDDAITARAIERARGAFGPEVGIDVVSDGVPALAWAPGVRWLQPLHMAIHGLDPDSLDGAPDRLRDLASDAGIGRARWRPLDPAAYEAAVLIGCGLSSTWSEGTIAPRAILATALRRAGVPVALSGQGYDLADDDLPLLAAMASDAVAVGCRDRAAADLVASLDGVDADRVSVTGDDALDLAPSAVVPPTTAPYVAVTVRHAAYVGTHDGDALARWVRAVDDLAVDRGWDVVGLALNGRAPEPEVATLARVRATVALRARWHTVVAGPDPRDLVALLAPAGAVAAQSYHAALLGLASGVPSVLAAGSGYYRSKASGLAGLAGLPDALAVADPGDLAASLAAVEEAMEARPAPLVDATNKVDEWWAALPSVVRC